MSKGFVNERGSRAIELRKSSGELTVLGRLNAVGVDQLLAVDRASYDANWQLDSVRTTWVLTDRQGTVRDLISKGINGTPWLQHIDYDAFGVPNNLGGLATAVTTYYAGREYDFYTDLYYNRARWYDPAMQRFISEDPIGFAGGDPNLYRYCGNSPINATDPSGCVSMGEVADWMYGSDGWLFDIDTRATSFFDAHPEAASWMAARSDAAIYSAAVVASVPLGIAIFYGAPYLAAAAVAAGPAYFVSVAESLRPIFGRLALYKRDASLSSWFVTDHIGEQGCVRKPRRC